MTTNLAGTRVARADQTELVADWPGQRAARFERDVLPHLDRVYHAARCMAADRAAAEDLAEETFARAYAAFGQVEPGTNVTTWLYCILITTFAASSGKQQREPKPAPVDGAGDRRQARAGSFTRGSLTPAQAKAVERLPGSDVNCALHELPPDLRIAVYLADVDGFACGEIAGIVTVPTETVVTRLHRGRRQLRELLRDYAAVRGRRVALADGPANCADG